jgi:hypothetical protein
MSKYPFYSEVNSNLQLELRARGKAGFYNRRTEDLRYMLEKVANIEITPYLDSEFTDKIFEGVLGGKEIRRGPYIPTGDDGFLTSFKDGVPGDRQYDLSTVQYDSTTGEWKTSTNTNFNKSRKTGPYIRSAEIAIADNATGTLNEATINITIPDPERDLEYIESIYFRPGRRIRIEIQHPTSAVLTSKTTEGKLKLESDIREKVRKLKNKTITESEIDSYFKLNSIRFDGILTSFTWNYTDSMSVDATISVRGTSNVYTDLNFIINQEQSVEKTESATNSERTATGDIQNDSFYQSLINDVNAKISDKTFYKNPDKPSEFAIKDNINGYTYITLYWLINSINSLVLSKHESAYAILFDSELCKSNYYSELVSSDPERVLLPDPINRTYGTHIYLDDVFKLAFTNQNETIFKLTENNVDYYNPTNILININTIKEYITASKNVNDLLKKISTLVSDCTGNAIELNLLTPPDPDQQDNLLWFDKKLIANMDSKPFSIPMNSNHEFGTVVREFTMDAKLPDSVASLSYVLSGNVGKLNESEISPFLAYMYSTNTVVRDGNRETRTPLTKENEDAVKNLDKTYREKAQSVLRSLINAKTDLGNNYKNTTKKGTLKSALKQYISYPTESIRESNRIAPPVIPIQVDFTIDGINGFRFGDILIFDMLPSRYRNNVVWQIINITHSVNEYGAWTTKIKCHMRTKI